MNSWSASQYLKFEDERSRPARDLLAQVPLDKPRRVVDIGCGPGNSTELLAARYPQAEIVGLDTSADMLAAARKRLPRVSFVEADIARWSPDSPVDLFFANATLQWVPRHLEVMARLLAALPAGGILAVQMPDNLGEPSHRLMQEIAADGPWAGKFATPIEREAIAPPSAYYDRLAADAARSDIWHTVYNHALASPAAIVEWVKGTGLRPFVDRLDPGEQAEFLARYEKRVGESYPPLADGRRLFRFPRIFIVAVRL